MSLVSFIGKDRIVFTRCPCRKHAQHFFSCNRRMGKDFVLEAIVQMMRSCVQFRVVRCIVPSSNELPGGMLPVKAVLYQWHVASESCTLSLVYFLEAPRSARTIQASSHHVGQACNEIIRNHPAPLHAPLSTAPLGDLRRSSFSHATGNPQRFSMRRFQATDLIQEVLAELVNAGPLEKIHGIS